MSIDELRTKSEQAEQSAQEIMAEKDAKLDEVRGIYNDRLREANQQAADAQKRLADAEVVEALRDQPDGEATAAALGLSWPD